MPQVKREDPKGHASCVDGQVCANSVISKRKKLKKPLDTAGVVRDGQLCRQSGSYDGAVAKFRVQRHPRAIGVKLQRDLPTSRSRRLWEISASRAFEKLLNSSIWSRRSHKSTCEAYCDEHFDDRRAKREIFPDHNRHTQGVNKEQGRHWSDRQGIGLAQPGQIPKE